jgi:hypothetical protein
MANRFLPGCFHHATIAEEPHGLGFFWGAASAIKDVIFRNINLPVMFPD